MSERYAALIDIENNLGVFADRSIPGRQARDAGKLYDAIRRGDGPAILPILLRYQHEASRGDCTGGPKQIKCPDVVKATIGRLAALGYNEVRYGR